MTSPEPTGTDLAPLTGAWTLDPDRTSIVFHTKAMWVLNVKGTLRALEGGGSVQPDGGISGTLVIDPASIDTKNKKRDDHLRTADFFEVEQYPTITYAVSTARIAAPGHAELDGTLTVHGQTRPITVTATVDAGGESATVSAETDIDRSAWGMTWAKMGAGVKNKVTISAHFDRVPTDQA